MNPKHPRARDPFLFELALKLGMTVRELQSRLLPEEYLEWVAYKAAVVQYKTHLSKGKHPKTLIDW